MRAVKNKSGMTGWVMALVLGLSGCKMNNDFADKALENQQAIEKYIAENGISATKDKDGNYYYKSISDPFGTEPQTGQIASIYYRTYTLGGQLIDSTESSKGPTVMPVGTAQYNILGLEIALLNLKVGEKASYFLPFYNAYGTNSFRSAPAFSPVRLEIELVDLRSEKEVIDDYIAQKGYTVSERFPDGWVLIRTNTPASGRVAETAPTPTGDTLGVGKSATVAYTGTFLNGTQFDKGTLTYNTGSGMITGFDRAVRRMRVGERGITIFPSALGYGDSPRYDNTGRIAVRSYSSLIFELEIK